MFEGLMGSLMSLVIIGAVFFGLSIFIATLLIWIFRTEGHVVDASGAYEPPIDIPQRRVA